MKAPASADPGFYSFWTESLVVMRLLKPQPKTHLSYHSWSMHQWLHLDCWASRDTFSCSFYSHCLIAPKRACNTRSLCPVETYQTKCNIWAIKIHTFFYSWRSMIEMKQRQQANKTQTSLILITDISWCWCSTWLHGSTSLMTCSIIEVANVEGR